MTKEELDAIESRAYAAAPAPWTFTIKPVDWAPITGVSIPEYQTYVESTARFIAAARMDVPALIQEIRRLNELMLPQPKTALEAAQYVLDTLNQGLTVQPGSYAHLVLKNTAG